MLAIISVFVLRCIVVLLLNHLPSVMALHADYVYGRVISVAESLLNVINNSVVAHTVLATKLELRKKQ